jgi:hypothetical protein
MVRNGGKLEICKAITRIFCHWQPLMFNLRLAITIFCPYLKLIRKSIMLQIIPTCLRYIPAVMLLIVRITK